MNLLLEYGYFNIISELRMEQSKSLSSQKTLGKEANSFSRDFSSKEDADRPYRRSYLVRKLVMIFFF